MSPPQAVRRRLVAALFLAIGCALLLLPALAPARAEEEAPAATKALAPSWQDQAQAAYAAKDWGEAIFLYRKWLEADPQDETSWYNLACCQALAGQREAALQSLETAVEAGWKDPAWPSQDPDLASIRDDARFLATLEDIRTRGDRDAPKDHVRHFVPIPAIGTYIAMLPPGYDPKTGPPLPLVVILHGNGSSETKHGRLADRIGREGVLYLAPRAPYPSEGAFLGMREPGWTWKPEGLGADEAKALDASKLYVDSILAAVNDAKKHYRVKGDKFYVLGHSMGAFFANTVAVLHPDKVASYYAYAGGIPEGYQDPLLLKPLAEHGVKAYLAHGRMDPVVPVGFTEKAKELLEGAGVDVVTVLFDDQDHGIDPWVVFDMEQWVDEIVRGIPPTVTNIPEEAKSE